MDADTSIVVHLEKTRYRMAMLEESDEHYTEGEAVFLFDKSQKVIAMGIEAKEKYKNPGLFTRKKKLVLLDFEWMHSNKVKDDSKDFQCIDNKSIAAVDAFSGICSALHREAMRCLGKSKKKENNVTVIISPDIPLQSSLDEAIKSERTNPLHVVVLSEKEAAFTSFAQSYDDCTIISEKSKIGDGELTSDTHTVDFVVVASIKENSSIFSFFTKDSEGNWNEDTTKERHIPTLSTMAIKNCLENLLKNAVDKKDVQARSEEILIKQLSNTAFSEWRDISFPPSLNGGGKVDFTREQISLAFKQVKDRLKDVLSAEEIQTVANGERKGPKDVLVASAGFQCLDVLDDETVKVNANIDILHGILKRRKVKKVPVKITLEVSKDMTYSYKSDIPVPRLAVLQFDQNIDSKVLQDMPIKDKDDMWSESEIINLKDNRPHLRFHQNLEVQEPISITFELFDTCCKEDKLFYVLVWDNESWKMVELSLKENVVDFELHWNNSFYITSKSRVTETVLNPSEDFIYTGKDELSTLRFKAGSTSADTKIECKVIGVRKERMKQSESLAVFSITKGILVHMEHSHEFNKAVNIQLPFIRFDDEAGGDDDEEGISETMIFSINDDGDVSFVNNDAYYIQDGCIHFQTTHFSIMGAAIARSNSRESALSQISRCYNGKSGHRIFTLMRQNMHDIDVWFAIFETENYKKLRDRFIEDKRTENFKEITASNSSEVFLKDGWNLRFFITEGAKNLSHEYHKFIGGSNYNLKLIKIMPTLNKAKFAECRVMKKNDGGKHEELLVFPFDIARAVAPSMRKPQGIQNVEPWQQRFPQGISHKVPRGNNRALPSERMHTEYQGWLNDKILRELASNLEEKDIWQLGIQLEIEVDTLTKIEKEFSKDITRYAFQVLRTWKRGRRSHQPENYQVKFLQKQLQDIERHDLAIVVLNGFRRKKRRLFDY